ncbi:BTB/POZ domain-containing protein KCTD12-like [Tropilaelaps mercedesae]|uniref:BTB/POZ domain-containing protein KCTD12-like n=1 Tax=Tropilaelaps mercedesae TaxID=418985 RepID=A0A1V9XJ16_9ACAR|nr:BTB/POZ domain-containing protein KCTD12-like [Tropilaelaps mercedesae]
MLQEARFQCVCACGSGTSSGGNGGEPLKPGLDSEEQRWNHYNEFVFVRN